MSRKTTPTYVLLNQITLAAASSSVTFSNILQNYGDLVIVSNFGMSGGSATLLHEFNGDTGNNYSRIFLNSNPSSGTSTNPNIRIIGTTTSYLHTVVSQIFDYSVKDKYKSALFRGSGGSTEVLATSARWASTSSITSIKVFVDANNFSIGSTFSLYGLVT